MSDMASDKHLDEDSSDKRQDLPAQEDGKGFWAEGGRLDRLVRRTEEILFTVIVLTMIAMGLIPVILRYFSTVGIVGTEPLTRHLVLWIALLGAGTAVRERSSISIDVVSQLVSTRTRLVIRGVTELISALVCGTLMWISVRYVRSTAGFETSTFALVAIREWWLTWALPIGFFLLTLRLLIASAQDALAGLKGTGDAQCPTTENLEASGRVAP